MLSLELRNSVGGLSRRSANAVVALLLLVAASGCAGADANTETRTANTVPTDAVAVTEGSEGYGHDHEHGAADRLREWAGSPVPTVEVSIAETADRQWTLAISADGFTFTPANVIEPVDGQGHAHLYVDGRLMTMIYKQSFKLPRLDPGTRHLVVTLSTNDHLEYSSNGEPIAGVAVLEIPPPEAPAAVVAADDPAPVHEVVTITLTIAGGHLRKHLHLVPVPLGATLQVTVQSDVADQLVIPDYNIDQTVSPDEPLVIEFAADTPGVFDIRLDHISDHTIQFEVG
jgi:hypothetical protein